MESFSSFLAVLDLQITDEDRKTIDELVPPGTMISPFYEADFGPHPFRLS